MPVMKMIATAYVATCLGCSGVTASGVKADASKMIIAASPRFKIGTCLEVKLGGKWVRYTVLDRGPRDGDHIDILMEKKSDAVAFGRQNVLARTCVSR